MSMVGETIGMNRAEAVWRVLFLVLVSWWLLPILAAVALITGLSWMLLDVLGQVIWNTEHWSPGGMGTVQNTLERVTYWPVDMAEWTLFGSREFPWLP